MKIINNVRLSVQKVLFLVIFFKIMELFVRRILVKFLEIIVGGRSVVVFEIDQCVEVCDGDMKFICLFEIFGEMGEEYKDEDDFCIFIFVDC